MPKGISLTSKFGERIHPVYKTKSFHNGIDLSMPVGTRVLAPFNGVVSDVWETLRGGIQMRYEFIIDDIRYTFGFAHLSRVVRHKGERCNKDDVIAYSGNTGIGTGAHLHFTIRVNGQLVDPITIYEKFNCKYV